MKYILLLVLAMVTSGCCQPEVVDNTCYSCIDSAKQEALIEIQRYKDSVQWLLDNDNMLIYSDSFSEVEARFDSITGIPYLIIKK